MESRPKIPTYIGLIFGLDLLGIGLVAIVFFGLWLPASEFLECLEFQLGIVDVVGRPVIKKNHKPEC